MLDLKPYFDAVNLAEAEVQRVAHELDALFTEGTEESTLQALELRPLLEEAQDKYAKAVSLYEAMQLANRPNDAARNFVPISTQEPEGNQPSVINRQDYDQLSLVDRARYIRSGGTLQD